MNNSLGTIIVKGIRIDFTDTCPESHRHCFCPFCQHPPFVDDEVGFILHVIQEHLQTDQEGFSSVCISEPSGKGFWHIYHVVNGEQLGYKIMVFRPNGKALSETEVNLEYRNTQKIEDILRGTLKNPMILETLWSVLSHIAPNEVRE